MVARRKRTDVLRRPRRIAVRSKATRKKATRRKKPRIDDVDSTKEVEAFQLLTDRLWEIYRRADERAADIGGEMRDLIDELEGKLDEKIDKLTSQTASEIEDLLGEVQDRNEELQYRERKGS
jgi:gas vesicle protein